MHHLSFDFRLGSFERADCIVMGMNPGETADDRSFEGFGLEESSEHDYRAGKDSPSRHRWFETCRRMTGSSRISLSELVFWSSPTFGDFARKVGPTALDRHLKFCWVMNEALVGYHQPKAVILPGLGLIGRAKGLYELEFVSSTADDRGRRLIEHYQRDGVPWIFTKHWSGSFGFSNSDREAIRKYIQQIS
jgi:hypothetical protein